MQWVRKPWHWPLSVSVVATLLHLLGSLESVSGATNQHDVKITAASLRANAKGTPRHSMGYAFTCYSPTSPEQAPSTSDVAQIFDSSVAFLTDPRRMLLSNDLLLCEVPLTDEWGQTHTHIYAMLGSVMVPHERLTALRDEHVLPRSSHRVQEVDIAKAESSHLDNARSDDPLLSFDEWKEQHLERKRKSRKNEKVRERAAQQSTTSSQRSFEQAATPASSTSSGAGIPRATSSESTIATGGLVNDTTVKQASKTPAAPPESGGPPHIYAVEDATSALAELKHRWNYASLDCAAMMHQANPLAKFAHAILSEKKDKYMLSPCPQSATHPGDRESRPAQQFVVIELCQQIRVDTIVLANLEFFSSMFKVFTVRVARSLHAPPDEWHTLGMFHARNARGFQVFQVSDAPLSYFRFLRIDFLEHYGTEYYCPVSLLRVYGRNEREDADDDILNDIDDDDTTEDEDATPSTEPILELTSTHALVNDRVVERACVREPFPGVWRSVCERVEPVVLPTPPALIQTPSTALPPTSHTCQVTQTLSEARDVRVPAPFVMELAPRTCALPSPPTPDVSRRHATATNSSVEAKKQTSDSKAKPKPNQKPAGDTKAGGSESIYRTITKRLSALESNTSLSMQYLQLSSQKMREKLMVLEQMQETRLAEFFAAMNASHGRAWEDKIERQNIALQRVLQAFESQRLQYENEQALLLARVEHLTRSVRSQKRWGTVQLLLALMLLMILAFTRGTTNVATVAGVTEYPPSFVPDPPSSTATPDACDHWEESHDVLARREPVTLTPRPVSSIKYARRRYATPSPRVRRTRRPLGRLDTQSHESAPERTDKENAP